MTDFNYVPYLSRLKIENPALLAEITRKGATSEARKAKPRKVAGAPRHMTNQQYAAQRNAARKTANDIMRNLELEDALPENAIAREAMRAAIEMIGTDLTSRDRLAVIRTLLDFNLARPAMTQNLHVKTAEDFLDELAAATEADDGEINRCRSQ